MKMLGLILVSLVGLGMAGFLILWVILDAKKQADYRSDRIAQADALMAKFKHWQVPARARLPVPLRSGQNPGIQPLLKGKQI